MCINASRTNFCVGLWISGPASLWSADVLVGASRTSSVPRRRHHQVITTIGCRKKKGETSPKWFPKW